MRRFYQLECQDHIDWETVNALDYSQLWQSVDESKESPIKAHLEALRAHQEVLRAKDLLEQWLDERTFIPTGKQRWSTSTELYEDYQKFLVLRRHRGSPPSHQMFGRKLRELLDRLFGPGVGYKDSDGAKYKLLPAAIHSSIEAHIAALEEQGKGRHCEPGRSQETSATGFSTAPYSNSTVPN